MNRHLTPAEVEAVFRSGRRYRSRVVVTASRLGRSVTWKTAAGDELTAAAGDWWVELGDERWSVARDVFGRTYEHVEGALYRKMTQVEAVRLAEDVTVETLEGPATGREGDWLVRNETGESWPVPNEGFEKRYEPAE